MEALQTIADLKRPEYYPSGWEGVTASFRDSNNLLRFHVESLTRELETRGHRVELDGCNVFVNRPFAQPLFTLGAGRNRN
jgi:hypothetical protein